MRAAAALYNHVRFGGFTNFGERYELAGIDQTKAPFYSLAWILPGPVHLSAASGAPVADLPARLPADRGSRSVHAAARRLRGRTVTAGSRRRRVHRRCRSRCCCWRSGRCGGSGARLSAAAVVATGLASWAGHRTLVSWALFGDHRALRGRLRHVLPAPGIPGLGDAAGAGPSGPPRAGCGRSLGVAADADRRRHRDRDQLHRLLRLLEIEHPATFNALEDVTGPLATVATMIRGKPEITRVTSTEPLRHVAPDGLRGLFAGRRGNLVGHRSGHRHDRLAPLWHGRAPCNSECGNRRPAGLQHGHRRPQRQSPAVCGAGEQPGRSDPDFTAYRPQSGPAHPRRPSDASPRNCRSPTSRSAADPRSRRRTGDRARRGRGRCGCAGR